MNTSPDSPELRLGLLAAVGAAIGVGKLLAGGEPITARLVFGRALVSAGLGAAASATSLLFPTADPLVLYGVAAGLASVGTSALESIMARKVGGGP